MRPSALLCVLVLVGRAGVVTAAVVDTATLTVRADNPTGAAIDVTVSGELASDAVTPIADGATSYSQQMSCAPGATTCGTVTDLRPGAWVHRLTVTVPGSDPQVQAQRAVLVGGEPGLVTNTLTWTVYPHTFLVTSNAADSGPGTLRNALAFASGYTATHPGAALVTFSRMAFPGLESPQTIDLAGACLSNSVAICLDGDRIVVDGLDDDARTGAVVWSVGARPITLIRISGSDDVLRGIVLEGSQADVADPETCGAEGSDDLQRDTVAVVGPDAHGFTLERSVVRGPTCGDAVSVQAGAAGVVVSASEISGAQDRGVKANDGAVEVRNSCVYDNGKGGLQGTLGGDVLAVENVVQRNRGGTGQNGMTVVDQCRSDNLGCVHAGRSRLVTEGNVVRFSGGRGLSVRDNAEASSNDDYVADNAVKGTVVETTETVPHDEQGDERVPQASFRGTAVVCNRTNGDGVGAEVRADAGHDAPVVDYGDADAPGANAFTSNRRTDDGANLLLTNVAGPIAAAGNQWAHCTGQDCDVRDVRDDDILPLGANVALGGTGTSLPGSRAGLPVVERITPSRPQAGDVVRVFGRNFDAIEGNPTKPQCDAAALLACSDEMPCPSGPCVDGECPCSITNALVQARNPGDVDNPPNRILIAAGGTVIADLAPDAVTPTMLAFHLPFDCYAALVLGVVKHGAASAQIALCDPQALPTTTTTTSTTLSTTTTSSSSSSSTFTTTTSSSTTTSMTLPSVCGTPVPAAGAIAQCGRAKVRRKATRLVRRLERLDDTPGKAQCRIARRLATVMRRCG